MQAAGLDWYARVGGNGRAGPHVPPVVLVHGFGVSSAYFVPAAERLGCRLEVYAPDLPGHGKTFKPPSALDVAGLGAALAEWLDAVGLGRVSVIAHSMGCQVAVELAVRRAGIVDRLVLVGPTMDRQARGPAHALLRLVAGSGREGIGVAKVIVKDYARMNVRLVAEARAMFRDRIEEKLPRVAAPVLFVRGSHDKVAPSAWVDELRALAPNDAGLVVVDGGHAVQYGAADAFVTRVLPFLAQSSVPDTR